MHFIMSWTPQPRLILSGALFIWQLHGNQSCRTKALPMPWDITGLGLGLGLVIYSMNKKLGHTIWL